jgi:hypothetical protein
MLRYLTLSFSCVCFLKLKTVLCSLTLSISTVLFCKLDWHCHELAQPKVQSVCDLF